MRSFKINKKIHEFDDTPLKLARISKERFWEYTNYYQKIYKTDNKLEAAVLTLLFFNMTSNTIHTFKFSNHSKIETKAGKNRSVNGIWQILLYYYFNRKGEPEPTIPETMNVISNIMLKEKYRVGPGVYISLTLIKHIYCPNVDKRVFFLGWTHGYGDGLMGKDEFGLNIKDWASVK